MKGPAGTQGAASVQATSSSNPLIRKLSMFVPLTAKDCRVLDSLTSNERRFEADQDIIVEGVKPRSVFVILEGMAIRYRALLDGGRQIITFLIPGDFCDLHAFLEKAMDHSIGTITRVRIADVPRDRLMDVFLRHPRISAALWWSSMQEEAMLRERIVSLGRRDARGRIAYFLCESLWRHAAIGLTANGRLSLPLTQTEMGDALGLTPVHVNRILKEFRSQRLIAVKQRVIDLLDIDGLQRIADFTKDYLQLQGISDEMAGYFDYRESAPRDGD